MDASASGIQPRISSRGGRVHGSLYAAGDAPSGVNALAADQLDDALAELAQADAAAREIEVVFEQAEEIALFGRGIHAEQEVGRREVEETQRVGLQQLGVVHQPALQHGGARHLDAEDGVAGLASSRARGSPGRCRKCAT